jgi:hypothetical protein
MTERGSSDQVVAPKHISKGKWLSQLSIIEMIVIKGNYWRIMGKTENGKNYLYPEEALYLSEKNLLVIVDEDGGKMYSKEIFYQLIIETISLPCYLCYSKLKVSFCFTSSSHLFDLFFADNGLYRH